MTWKPRVKEPKAFLLLIAVLVSLFGSQWLFSRARTPVASETPPAFALVSIAIGVVSLYVGRMAEDRPESASDRQAGGRFTPVFGIAVLAGLEKSWRHVAFLLSLLLLFLLLRKLPMKTAGELYHVELLAWVSSILLYLLAVVRVDLVFPRWRSWWRSRQRLALAVGAIIILAFILRVWRLGTIPFTLSGDEASQGLEAIRVIEGEIRNPFSTGWLNVPTMSFFYNSVTIRLLGPSVAALRLPWALIGTATVFITFLLVKQLKGTSLALVAAALLATYHYHIHYSRLGSNQIADPFFMALALLFLSRALDKGSHLDWAMTGVVGAMALYAYAGARLTPVVIATVLGYALLRDPRGFWQRHRAGASIAVGALLIVGAPMVQYAIRFPNEFNARINQVGIIQSGWLDQEVAVRGESEVAVLLDQFRRAALAFNYYPDRTVWYGLPQPLLSPLFGSIFLLGLGYGTLRLFGRRADDRLAPMAIWWWMGVVFGGVLTESPPSSQRLITLSVPVCFFIALALWEIVRLARKGIVGVPGRALIAILVLLFALGSLVTYFLEFTPRRIAGGSHAELATEVAPRLRELSPENRIYFVGAPWMYWGFATFPYLVPEADAVDITVPVTEFITAGLVRPEKDAIFVFIPQRVSELETVRKMLPGGEVRRYYSPVDGHVLVTLYEVEL